MQMCEENIMFSILQLRLYCRKRKYCWIVYLRQSFFTKIVNSYNLLTIFSKMFYRRFSTSFKKASDMEVFSYFQTYLQLAYTSKFFVSQFVKNHLAQSFNLYCTLAQMKICRCIQIISGRGTSANKIKGIGLKHHVQVSLIIYGDTVPSLPVFFFKDHNLCREWNTFLGE